MRLRLRPLALRRLALLALLALLSAFVAPATSAATPDKFFNSPSKNIGCQVGGRSAYCQTFKPLRSVTLSAAGALKTCSGVRCVGNGPTNAFTLAYGRSVNAGPFRCTSLLTGMQCIVVRTSHGFRISRAGVTRV